MFSWKIPLRSSNRNVPGTTPWTSQIKFIPQRSLHSIWEETVCVCSVARTLCDPMDSSPPGSSDHGILQARKLEWVALFFWGSSWPKDRTWVSYIGRQILYHLSHQGSPNNAYIRWQSKHSGETYSRGRRRGKQGCELHFKERWSGKSPQERWCLAKPSRRGGAVPPSGLGTLIMHTRQVVLRQSLNSSVPALSPHGVRMLRDQKEWSNVNVHKILGTGI